MTIHLDWFDVACLKAFALCVALAFALWGLGWGIFRRDKTAAGEG